MNIRTVARTLTTSLTATALIAVSTGTAWAQHGGGFHGGAAVHGAAGPRGGAVIHGGVGFRGSPGFRGYPGFRGGYGFRGYGWGWRPGFGWWWWGWGLPLGVYLSTLPYYYSTVWWDGVPYYYGNGDYYIWNNTANQYEQVQPPADVMQQSGSAVSAPQDLYAYPTRGQSPDQQARDKIECRAWASGQVAGAPPSVPSASNEATTGPSVPPGAMPPGPAPGSAPPPGAAPPAGPPAMAAGGQDFLRAEAACLEARGYSVK